MEVATLARSLRTPMQATNFNGDSAGHQMIVSFHNKVTRVLGVS